MAKRDVRAQRMRRLPPVILALLLQLAAFLLVTFVVRLFALTLPPLTFAIACGLLATALSHLARQARWWLPMQLLFVPALTLTLDTDVPPAFFLFAFLLLLMYWSTFRTRYRSIFPATKSSKHWRRNSPSTVLSVSSILARASAA